MSLQDDLDRLQDGRNPKKKWEFTLEPGKGETYRHQRPVLYGHSEYERGSVLAGQPQRVWIAEWDSWEAARKECNEAKFKGKKLKFDDFGEQGGSTHIPVAVITAHLPDDEG